MTSSEIRQQFLEFFQSKKHLIVPSAPIVVKNDPTLLFTNAGMNQFKDMFLGNQPPISKRVADTQKCLRVSGKHNDLEEVGVDTYHHTMFEMLGNWSFGDYFKAEAIAWSWELLTEIYKLDKDRLYVTVFEGSESDNLPFDQEAYDEWKKWIAEDRILKGSKKDNFWEMGETGPCGTCSEIHVDCRSDEERKHIDGKTLVNNDHPQVIEIWNNVFMQYNRMKDGSLQSLPAKHVDTGMGFERLVRVLQGKNSNYDTDIFSNTIALIEKITTLTYQATDSKQDIAFRVIADHIRAIAFSIADGQLPSNTGAGYVIRRILRRAVRYYFTYLHYKKPLLFQLISLLAAQFKDVFPELEQQTDFVSKVIKEEEEAFLRTLEKGLKRIDEIIQKEQNSKIISGKEAFELNDTYGFPIDLTRLIASENNFTVDEKEYEQELEQQKNRSRQATAIDTGDWVELKETPNIQFIGYHQLETTTHIVKYRKIKAKNKEQYQIVLEKTPFYPESGGQVGDKGYLYLNDECIEVINTKKENDLIIHLTNKIFTQPQGNVKAVVNQQLRKETTYNHTATHLLHAALKQILGSHVNQKGSLVSAEILRFDVSHFAKITDEELQQITQIVNQAIRANIPVQIEELPKEEALQRGATALFGEKYGDIVRIVTIDPTFSIELCGGTHVCHTGEIGCFVIINETAVAAGVRRIEALTGAAALNYLLQKASENKEIIDLLKTKEPIKAIQKLQEEKAALEKAIEAYQAKELASLAQKIAQKARLIQQVHFIGEEIHVTSADALKKVCFDIKQYLSHYLVVLTANINGKANVAIAIDETLATNHNLDAGKIIKQTVAPLIKGGGGGQKTLATAGGQDTSQLKKVIEAIETLIK